MRPYQHVLVAALVLSSVPTFAATHTNGAANSPTTKPAADASASADRKYCITPDASQTGSRLYTRECRTKADWAKRGVEVEETDKQQ